MGGLILSLGLFLGAGVALWASLDRPAHLPTGQVPSDALQKLQWLADESRCHVSDNPALMAGCVRERIAKVRAKALAYKERYEALRDLDRVYFRQLREAHLVPLTTHVPDSLAILE